MSPHRALLIQLTMSLDQMSGAADDLVQVVGNDELVDVLELRRLLAAMTNRVDRAVRDVDDPASIAAHSTGFNQIAPRARSDRQRLPIHRNDDYHA